MIIVICSWKGRRTRKQRYILYRMGSMLVVASFPGLPHLQHLIKSWRRGRPGNETLQGAVAPPPPPPPPPFPVPTTPLIYTSTRLTVESATKKLKGSSVLDFFQRKQLVTVRMDQIQSQLVLGTKTVFSSDHVHGESSSNLTSHIYLFTSRIRRSRMTREPKGSECSAKA